MLQKIIVKTNKKVDKVYYLETDLFIEISEGSEKILVVETTALPLKGKANKKVVELVSEFFGVAKSQVIIKTGLTNKQKILEIVYT